jgi:ABC-2 type transport system permease protein
MGFILDIDRGITDRFLVAPIKRGSLVTGRLVYQAVVTIVQSLMIIGLGLVLGARIESTPLVIVAFIGAALLIALAFAAVSMALAITTRQQETVIGVVNFIVLPASFLSATFLPMELLPDWMQTAANFNPVNWAVEIGRQTLVAQTDWALILSRLGGLAILALLAAMFATRAFRSYQRSA